MKATATFIELALVFSISTIPARAQAPQTHHDRARENQAAQSELLLEMAERFGVDSAERSLDSMAAARDVASRMRLEVFVEDVYTFVGQLEELFPLRNVRMSEPGAQEEIEQVSKDLIETTGRLRNFVNFGTDPPQINVAPLPEEDLAQRIQRLVNLSGRLVPNIISLAGGDSVDLNLQNEVRDGLAITEVLSRALPESKLQVPSFLP